MKKWLFACVSTLIAISVFTQDALAKSSGRVKGYTKKGGTYVAPHHRTNPDRSKSNNYSSKGNVNPYTGKKGTKDPYKW